jgi:threonine/homoserine/homoserine lactone efflux protein
MNYRIRKALVGLKGYKTPNFLYYVINIIQNILLGISLAAPIGPVNIEVIKRGLSNGFFPAFTLSLGAASADTTYLILIYLGLSKFIHIPLVKSIIWIFGGVVLMYLGFLSIKEFCQKINLKSSAPKLNKNSYLAGYMITISNPMTIIWWLGVFGSILGTTVNSSLKLVALLSSLTIIVGVVVWFFILSVLLHWGKRFINETSLRRVSLIAGLILMGFGLYFEYSAISLFL